MFHALLDIFYGTVGFFLIWFIAELPRSLTRRGWRRDRGNRQR
jgi:hypothetical protein